MFSYTISYPVMGRIAPNRVDVSTKRGGESWFQKVKETYGQKKRSNALLQPLLTLNLIL